MPPSPRSHPQYRPDIDGLRAVAVVAVVAFHAFPEWIRGGFIGVDVFFVISGYLISTILLANLDRDTFSVAEFYARRIRRIFPALILVLASCCLFGWFTLLGDEYRQLGKHMAGGAGFVANLVSWRESGYFDNAADTKPLLHLWSLGVEEQFYIAWPLILWFGHRKRLAIPAIGIAIALVSFLMNVHMVKTHPVADFYSPLTRFWELMLGSILASVSGSVGRPSASAVSVLAALLLVYGFWRIDKALGFPGTWALVPVLGAVMLIVAGPGAWVNRVILSHRVAVWFGLISFPLYLWHWPLLAFVRIIGSGTPGPGLRAMLVLLAVLLAWLTYRFVERPVRTGGHPRRKVAMLVLLMPLVGLTGFDTFERHGRPARGVVGMNASLASGQDGGPGVDLVHDCGLSEPDKRLFYGCFRDPRGPVKYALIGDSKSAALWPGVVRTSSEAGRWLTIGGNGPTGGSVPVVSSDRIYAPYQKLSGPMIGALVDNPSIDIVVVATSTRALFQLETDYNLDDLPTSNNGDSARKALLDTTGRLVHAGKKVVFVVDNPTLPHPEDCVDRITALPLVNRLLTRANPKCAIALQRHLALSKKYRDLLHDVAAAYPRDVAIFDTMAYLCDEAAGQCGVRKDGRFLYGSTDHLSDYAAGLVGKALNRFLNGPWPSTGERLTRGP
jgi:peptidoglycan/LPS O-acetylase OafA/YrhL